MASPGPEYYLRCFSKIQEFVTQLNDVYGEQYKEIRLYNHLLDKTKVSHRKSIRDHVGFFADFCLRNRDAIIAQNLDLMLVDKVSFSEKVFIDVRNVISSTDVDDQGVIWSYLLNIQDAIDPTSGAREVLRKAIEEKSNEGNFIQDFMSKIENSVNKEEAAQDPMKVISSILKPEMLSGLVSNLNNGVENGSLDIGKLLGTVQGMLTGLTSQMNGGDGSAPSDGTAPAFDLGGMMGAITGMMGSLGGAMGGTSGTTDGGDSLSGALGGIGSLLGGGKPNPKALMAEVEKEMALKNAPNVKTETVETETVKTTVSSGLGKIETIATVTTDKITVD